MKGFETRRLPGARADVEIAASIGGEGPPVLLLHGFPQTRVAWRRVAPALAKRFTVVCADLRGYGESDAPQDEGGTYAKREMARDMRAAMRALGHERFAVAGHDRGGRVAYRLALDAPEAVERLALVEIVSTADQWRAFDAAMAMAAWHWPFLAQPAPFPEQAVGAAPDLWLERWLSGWSKAGDLSAFADAMDGYRAAFAQPARIAAFCADYRAGAGADREADEADLEDGRRIAAPTLLIAGERGFPARAGRGDPAAPWRVWASDLRAVTVDAGHFPAEEAPEATAAALRDFLAGDA